METRLEREIGNVYADMAYRIFVLLAREGRFNNWVRMPKFEWIEDWSELGNNPFTRPRFLFYRGDYELSLHYIIALSTNTSEELRREWKNEIEKGSIVSRLFTKLSKEGRFMEISEWAQTIDKWLKSP